MDDDLLEYIVRLINDGEIGEAYKEFREYHGIVNRFVCDNCLNTKDYTESFICSICGGNMSTRAVIRDREIERRET